MSARDTKESRDYTPQDVVNQSLVAFGQGTQFMRVSSRACRVLARHMDRVCKVQDLPKNWETIAVQLLERVRLIGRVSAQRAVEYARTHVDEEDVEIAIRRVADTSKTDSCEAEVPGGRGGGEDSDLQWTESP